MTWLVLGMVLTQHARAQTRPPTLRDDMWRNRAIKCVVNPANPAGPKQIGGIVGIAPQVLPPFTSTTWTFRFLNADLQATWTQPLVDAVADAAKHWSNVPGSSIQGVFDFAIGFETTDPALVPGGVTTAATLCNGQSEIFFVDDLSAFCTGNSGTHGSRQIWIPAKKPGQATTPPAGSTQLGPTA